jgi:AcrR family transcriptional regulator
MITKAEKTTQYIIRTVAPIFNKKGYAATSLNDIIRAVGMTKGAIYGNFKNKDELALRAFEYNSDMVLSRIKQYMDKGKTPLERLLNLVDFYKNYYEFTNDFGGCPIINTSVDAKNTHPALLEHAKETISTIEGLIAQQIEYGKQIGEIRKTIPGVVYSKRFFSLIQGAIFMSQTTNDKSYTTDCLNVIIDTINQRFK